MKRINRKNLPKWQKVLTANEIRHLREMMETVTLNGFKKLRNEQKELKAKWTTEPCWDCRFIAQKIGLEE